MLSDNPALLGLFTIVVGVGACLAYFFFSNVFLDKVLFPARGPNAGKNINRANMIRPWLFLFPALFALTLYLAYPVFETLRLSLTDRSQGGAFVGLANYRQMMNEAKFWEAVRNNMLWLIVVPAASTAFGLLVAQLTDRIRWGNFAKSLIFMPMAISFVGASVIFKLIYDTRAADQNQIGVLNAIWLKFDGGIGSVVFLQLLPTLLLLAFAVVVAYVAWTFVRGIVARGEDKSIWLLPLRLLVAVGGIWLIWISLNSALGVWIAEVPYGEPQTWLTLPLWNNFFLMVVLIWIQTGFAMVILSAALRGIPEETVEAAIVDGANPFQIFFKIKVPQIMGTIVVVWTTITLTVLKVFDIVFAMTNGQWETQVLANYMYDKLFRANDWGVGSASAIIIMLLVTPILVWNVYNARKEMK
ncbi:MULTISPECIES: carbohydrate ABC transporter permease [Stappiaceae]|jgi:alpha-glucoside transport system permease protein|uniref:Lactose transport system permease protein LacF n=2 Tax=Roseibium TaxID=150830 RepID=A0A0M6Y1V6_9HYPH|nr:MULTISPECIES: sugar ABC transporter permease [Stappiaceae]AMN51937.1 alpha-glucoside ABC transporter permease [Labrenzia sp. CP4]AQQ05029.1 alpha-glucoside ABC transporter permease [Roseibium aggregatum]QFS98035.1 Lactose transport system permease protein LacF [Labrenzia sp. THAF191b]QFT04349.1 Lactose transport system permease protein LacF [Labrenzia sp. THAF191a]QFT15893.1 Lactose transport system permease protein LacF [Labrenzia sp. THAF187b]